MILRPGWKTTENLHTIAGCAAAALLALASCAAGAIAVAVIVASYNLARGIAKIGKTRFNSPEEAKAHLAGLELNYEKQRVEANRCLNEAERLKRQTEEMLKGQASVGQEVPPP
jgi:hypothetical protein